MQYTILRNGIEDVFRWATGKFPSFQLSRHNMAIISKSSQHIL